MTEGSSTGPSSPDIPDRGDPGTSPEFTREEIFHAAAWRGDVTLTLSSFGAVLQEGNTRIPIAWSDVDRISDDYLMVHPGGFHWFTLGSGPASRLQRHREVALIGVAQVSANTGARVGLFLNHFETDWENGRIGQWIQIYRLDLMSARRSSDHHDGQSGKSRREARRSRHGMIAGTAYLYLLTAIIAFGLGGFAILGLRRAVDGAGATASIVAGVLLLLLGLQEFRYAVRFYTGRSDLEPANFDDGEVRGTYLMLLAPSLLALWISASSDAGAVNELVIWVVALSGLFMVAVLAKIISDAHWLGPEQLNRALVVGGVGVLVLLAAGGATTLLANNADKPPTCDGKAMSPGGNCIQMSGFGSGGERFGTYEEIKQRGEERGRVFRREASTAFTATGVLFLVVMLSAGVVVLARVQKREMARRTLTDDQRLSGSS